MCDNKDTKATSPFLWIRLLSTHSPLSQPSLRLPHSLKQRHPFDTFEAPSAHSPNTRLSSALYLSLSANFF